MMTPRLYTATACNFCQRSKIAFAAKKVEIEPVDIDLVARPPWYREMASGGSVPLLECDDGAIHGSTIINEYVDERWPDPPLLPGDPAARAAARMWIEWWNHGPTPAYEERLMNVRPDREEALEGRLRETLVACEARLEARGYDGGYWHGDALGLADAAAAPVFVRFAGLRHFHDFDVPVELGRVRAWRDALVADPIVRQTSPDEQTLIDVLTGYRDVIGKAVAAGHAPRVSGSD